MNTRYPKELRLKVLKEVEKKNPAKGELQKILDRYGVPKATYFYWARKWQDFGVVDDSPMGRPPSGFRRIVQQEVERAFLKWFGSPPLKNKR